MDEIQIGLQREPDSLHTVGSLLLLMLLLGYRESFSCKSLRIEADLNGFQKRNKKSHPCEVSGASHEYSLSILPLTAVWGKQTLWHRLCLTIFVPYCCIHSQSLRDNALSSWQPWVKYGKTNTGLQTPNTSCRSGCRWHHSKMV